MFTNYSQTGINDVARKHRAAILFFSACVLFFDSDIKVTLGKASVAGLGVSIDPVQVIPISLILITALTYRLIAFWVIILAEFGTDLDRAKSSARNQIDPQHPDEYDDQLEAKVNEIAYVSVNKWRFRRSFWEILLPTALGLISILTFLVSYFI